MIYIDTQDMIRGHCWAHFAENYVREKSGSRDMVRKVPKRLKNRVYSKAYIGNEKSYWKYDLIFGIPGPFSTKNIGSGLMTSDVFISMDR